MQVNSVAERARTLTLREPIYLATLTLQHPLAFVLFSQFCEYKKYALIRWKTDFLLEL